MPDFIPGDSTALVKAKITATEGSQVSVDAYFNPKEITVDKQIPWAKHKNTEGDSPTLEFTASEPKMLSCGFMFDMFEQKGDVYAEYISKLHEMGTVDDSLKRPPMVRFQWGNNLPIFEGVIENISVKYTLFLPDGTPTRATVQLKMKQASKLMNKDEAKAAAKKNANKNNKQTATTGQSSGHGTSSSAENRQACGNGNPIGGQPGPTGGQAGGV